MSDETTSNTPDVPAPPPLRATRDGDEKVWDYVVLELMTGGSLTDLLDRAKAAPKRWPWSRRPS